MYPVLCSSRHATLTNPPLLVPGADLSGDVWLSRTRVGWLLVVVNICCAPGALMWAAGLHVQRRLRTIQEAVTLGRGHELSGQLPGWHGVRQPAVRSLTCTTTRGGLGLGTHNTGLCSNKNRTRAMCAGVLSIHR